MRPLLIPTNSSYLSVPLCCFSLSLAPKSHNPSNVLLLRRSSLVRTVYGNPQFIKPPHFIRVFSSNSKKSSEAETMTLGGEVGEAPNERTPLEEQQWNVQVGNPHVPRLLFPAARLSSSDQAFFLFSFIACMTSIAFTSLVVAAVPTLHAMGRAATSLSKLADIAREELPSTMAAIRLSGMEISDLTLELSDLSQEIAKGVGKSTQAVQATEAGIRQIGSLAHRQTMSMIEERANLPVIPLQPIVVGAAKKTSRAVGQATKTLMNIISRGEFSTLPEDDNALDRMEI